MIRDNRYAKVFLRIVPTRCANWQVYDHVVALIEALFVGCPSIPLYNYNFKVLLQSESIMFSLFQNEKCYYVLNRTMQLWVQLCERLLLKTAQEWGLSLSFEFGTIASKCET